jgi:RND superfamily putative drug exporter
VGSKRELSDVLAQVGLFSKCTPRERRAVARHAQIVEMPAGTDLVVEGEPGDALSNGGFLDPGAESSRAAAVVASDFPASGQTDVVVLVTAKEGTVDDAAVRDAGVALTERVAAAHGVTSASS